jgi:hypothetical protein
MIKKEKKSEKIETMIEPSKKAKWRRYAKRNGVSIARLITFAVERHINNNN